MATVGDLSSSRDVAILDRAVLLLMEEALTGSWTPDKEADDGRRAALVAAAQLRLYGDRDGRGWFLLTTVTARAGMGTDDESWTIGFIPPIESFEDAPTADDVAGQRALFDGLDHDAGRTLAAALLTPAVTVVVTDDVGRYKHQRPHDLPERLEVIDVETAVKRLGITPGEQPFVDIPATHPLAELDPWWVPG